MPEIVGKRNRLGQVFVKPQRPRGSPRNLRNFEGVRKAVSVMIPDRRKKNLRLPLKAAKGVRVDYAVAVALVFGANRAAFLRLRPPRVACKSRAFAEYADFGYFGMFSHKFSGLSTNFTYN
jgi:hypothetical protein